MVDWVLARPKMKLSEQFFQGPSHRQEFRPFSFDEFEYTNEDRVFDMASEQDLCSSLTVFRFWDLFDLQPVNRLIFRKDSCTFSIKYQPFHDLERMIAKRTFLNVFWYLPFKSSSILERSPSALLQPLVNSHFFLKSVNDLIGRWDSMTFALSAFSWLSNVQNLQIQNYNFWVENDEKW